jgi:hypothetical protein
MRSLIVTLIILAIALSSSCITVYYLDKNHYDAILEATKTDTVNMKERSLDRKNYEGKTSNTIFYQPTNDKLTLYVMMVGIFLILIFIVSLILSFLLYVPIKYLLHPDQFRLIAFPEAEALQYLKCKLIEAKIISNNMPCSADDVVRFLERQPDEMQVKDE